MKSILTFLSIAIISLTVLAQEYSTQCDAPAAEMAKRFSVGVGNSEVLPVRFVGRYYTNVEQWELQIKNKSSSYNSVSGTYRFDCRTNGESACSCEWVSFDRKQ